MALIVIQFDCTYLVQEQIVIHCTLQDLIHNKKIKQDKVMKLHLTGFTFQYDTAVAAAVLDLPHTRHFLRECGWVRNRMCVQCK